MIKIYRILGSTAVILSSALMGIALSRELSERIKMLKEIKQAMVNIKSELEFRAPVLEECFKRRGQLFSKAHLLIHNESIMPTEAVKCAAKDLNYLNKTDMELIECYADNLKNEDIGGQIANADWFINELNGKIRAAEEEYKAKGRLYRNGGLLAGIGVVILFI